MAGLPSVFQINCILFFWSDLPTHLPSISHGFFIQSSTDACLGCFHILALVNMLSEISQIQKENTVWSQLCVGSKKVKLIETEHWLPWVGERGLRRCWSKVEFELYQFSSVQSLSRVRLFATPWIAARQASLSITSSQSLLKLMSVESVMPSSHLIFCRLLLLVAPIPPSIRVFSNESTLCIRWRSIGVSASASVLPVNTQDWSPLGWTGWISLQPKCNIIEP